MIFKPTLPKEYIPYKEIEFFSNKASDYSLVIKSGEFSPVLIGKGEGPKIWLAQQDKNNQNKWEYLVYSNKSFHPELVVNSTESETEIIGGGICIIKAKELSKEKVLIEKLDLRPIGYLIYGEGNNLTIGSAHLSGNIFNNVTNIIAID